MPKLGCEIAGYEFELEHYGENTGQIVRQLLPVYHTYLDLMIARAGLEEQNAT